RSTVGCQAKGPLEQRKLLGFVFFKATAHVSKLGLEFGPSQACRSHHQIDQLIETLQQFGMFACKPTRLAGQAGCPGHGFVETSSTFFLGKMAVKFGAELLERLSHVQWIETGGLARLKLCACFSKQLMDSPLLGLQV